MQTSKFEPASSRSPYGEYNPPPSTPAPGRPWDRLSIVHLLATSDRAVEKALLVLLARQTADEQQSESTRHHNGRGFTGVDAPIFTSFAKQVQRGWRLSPKQLAVCRKQSPKGSIRIGRYWAQLLEEIEMKQNAAKAA